MNRLLIIVAIAITAESQADELQMGCELPQDEMTQLARKAIAEEVNPEKKPELSKCFAWNREWICVFYTTHELGTIEDLWQVHIKGEECKPRVIKGDEQE